MTSELKRRRADDDPSSSVSSLLSAAPPHQLQQQQHHDGATTTASTSSSLVSFASRPAFFWIAASISLFLFPIFLPLAALGLLASVGFSSSPVKFGSLLGGGIGLGLASIFVGGYYIFFSSRDHIHRSSLHARGVGGGHRSASEHILFGFVVLVCGLGGGVHFARKGHAGWQQQHVLLDNPEKVTARGGGGGGDDDNDLSLHHNNSSSSTVEADVETALAVVGSLMIVVLGCTVYMWMIINWFQMSS